MDTCIESIRLTVIFSDFFLKFQTFELPKYWNGLPFPFHRINESSIILNRHVLFFMNFKNLFYILKIIKKHKNKNA